MNETLDIRAPKGWNELDVKQLRIVAKLIDLNLDRETLLLTAFCSLSGVKIRHDIHGIRFVYGKKVFKLEPYQLQDFSNRMAWLLDDNAVDIVNPTTVQSHIINIKFEDYFVADTLMSRFDATQEPKYVRKAMRKLGRFYLFMPKIKANMIRLWWCGVQGYLHDLYPFVFAKGTGNGGVKSYFSAYQNLMLMLNENRPQDNGLINTAEVHDVLSALNNKIDQYEKMKEAMKK